MRLALGLAIACLLAPASARAGVYEIRPGDDLFARLAMLTAGDEVIVHGGTYTTPGLVQVTWAGTEAAPIIVRAAPGARPVIAGTPAQNVLDVGGSHFTLRGFELRGGSHGVRLAATDHATLEDLVLHDLGDVGISCNRPAQSCAFLTIRKNEIYDTGKAGTGEGMYLGCTAAACTLRDSLVERNFVHDTGGDQGDGIEVKPGASNVVVRDNVIVRSKYPGITMYGFTGSAPPNIIERNLVWTTQDNGIQIVGQVRVRNNIVLGAMGNGIHSKASDGHVPHDLQILNNTVVDAGVACLKANDWAGAKGQVVANNALYCEASAAIDLNGGAPSAITAGNVGRGTSNAATGFALGRSLAEDLTAPGSGDVYPRAGSPLENGGNGALAPSSDFDGCVRRGTMSEVGAYELTTAAMRIWPVTEAIKPPANCGGEPPEGDGPGGGDSTPPGDGGCCQTGGGSAPSRGLCAALVLLALRRRRRRRRRSGHRR
ncbi:MAG TPA: right-handed parallel beta-helix repeat-containing protein [Kofleriaceae bacterium]|nr:right-handed parallel beta-helix repeat-containing protein [Kofleriaceae bacterium]